MTPASGERDRAPALELRGISKRFDGALALDDASLTLQPGHVHALLGENGAGKTTLARVAFGEIRADAGSVFVDGRVVRSHDPAVALAIGIGMVHQHFTLVPAMTVAENLALGGHGRYRVVRARARVGEIARETGLALDPDARLRDLPVGAQQRVEIAKAIAGGARRSRRVLLLDEPTAVLAPPEVAELLAWLRRFAGAGNAVLLVTHKLREALAVSDEVTVLRRGRVVVHSVTRQASEQSLAAAMLGVSEGPPLGITMAAREASRITESSTGGAISRAACGPAREVRLRARDLELRDVHGTVRIRAASFDVSAGEIVGIAAVEGSGQRELLRALAGRLAPARGTIERPARVGFVPEDRQRDALVLDFTVVENVALADAASHRGRMRWREYAERAASLVAKFDVRTRAIGAPTRELSGGNQQKLVLARELDASPLALVAENPTRGLDIRAAAAVHARLRAARAAGAAIVLHASDLEEVISLADRVLVVHGGHVSEVRGGADAVGQAMLGATV